MEPLRDQLGMALGELSRAWRNRVNERLKPLNMSQGKYLVLRYLGRNPQGLAQVELACLLGIEGPTLVRLLDQMEAAGLIRRTPSEADRRRKIIRLGLNAETVMMAVNRIIDELRQHAMGDLDDDTLARGLALIRHIHGRIS